MKKLLGLTLTTALLSASSTIPSFAVAKAGAACSKAGLTSIVSGKKYTCIKLGKKLVWDKGVSVVIPAPGKTSNLTPTPSPTPTQMNIVFSPWASKFDASTMTQSALEATSDFFGKVTPSKDYEITIDQNITQSDRYWITNTLDYVNGAFTKVQHEKVRIFLGTTRDWSRKTLRTENIWVGDPQADFPCSQGIYDAYCTENNLIVLIYSDIYAPNSQFTWDLGRRTTPAHEFFHTIQYSLGGSDIAGPLGRLDVKIPRWLTEGSANYFGFYIADKLKYGNYQDGRTKQINANLDYQTVVPLKEYSFSNLNPYGIGQAATEYLIASIGFGKLLDIFKFTNTENSFSAGFKKATGIDIEDFYSKFEAARSSMHIGS